MEHIIGQYIRTVGTMLVEKQARLDKLQLTKDDIDWFLTQGVKETSQLIADKQIPLEDLAPALFLPPLPATPAPSAQPALPSSTWMSPLTSLASTLLPKPASPIISELATPLGHIFSMSSGMSNPCL